MCQWNIDDLMRVPGIRPCEVHLKGRVDPPANIGLRVVFCALDIPIASLIGGADVRQESAMVHGVDEKERGCRVKFIHDPSRGTRLAESPLIFSTSSPPSPYRYELYVQYLQRCSATMNDR
jgi:hypothetical protein